MKFLSKIFNRQKIIIAPMGCVHLGSKHCAIEKFKYHLKWVESLSNVYIIGMGDLIEIGTKSSPGGSVFEQDKFSQEQVEEMVDLLYPVRKKIIGLLPGNHCSSRIYNESGLDITKLMARMLNVPYLSNSVLMKLKVGSQNYTLFATHGSSNARLMYTKIKSCIDFSRYIVADIYCMGHVHSLDHMAQTYYRINNRKGCIEEIDRHFVITGSYLRYAGSYAEEKNLVPGKIGSPKIKLGGKERSIRISL